MSLAEEVARISWAFSRWDDRYRAVLALAKRIEELESFVREVRDGWDCDEDAHTHGTRCRACVAKELLNER